MASYYSNTPDINGYKRIDQRFLGYSLKSVPMDAKQFGLVLQEDIGRRRFPTRRSGSFFSGSSSDEYYYNLSQLSETEIPFQYIEQIPFDAKNANYNDVGEIMGRFESIGVYSNSNAQDISLTAIYYAEGTTKDSSHTTPWTIESIELLKKRLKSLTYPNYENDEYRPPAKVLLNIFNIFIKVPVTVRSVSIDESVGPYTQEGVSMTKKISLELKTSYPLWQSISSHAVKSEEAGNEVFAYKEF